MNIVRMLISRGCVRFFAAAMSLVLLSAPGALADVRLPAIFGNHMVLQQNQKDRVWGWADQVEVRSDNVTDPVAVRYAWADNPVCNLHNREALPVTPFRTDDWPGITAANQK